jgi:2-polyprenyl-6-methoxyphenol hydroxylase-like FAD-dependent oxidoreductase
MLEQHSPAEKCCAAHSHLLSSSPCILPLTRCFDRLLTWLDVHPCRDDPVAPLFVTIGSGCGGAKRGDLRLERGGHATGMAYTAVIGFITCFLPSLCIMRVGIVGGGLAGLSLAGLLEQAGCEYTVIEQASEWQRLGYGIGLWSDGIQVLNELGVDDTAYEYGEPLDSVAVRSPGGKKLTEYVFAVEGRTPFIVIHRADVHKALRDAVPTEHICMDATPTTITEHGEKVVVTLQNGEEEQFDVLVGADGVHSTVRDQCFDGNHVRNTNIHVWSFWEPDGIDVPDTTTSMWSPGTEVLATSINGRGLINIATHRKPEASTDQLLERTAEEMGWILPDAVAAVDEDKLFHDTITAVKPFDWTSNRVVLVGDAAHAVDPISGMGASLALQDASALATAITANETPTAILDTYTDERRPIIRKRQRQARILEWIAFSNIPGIPTLACLLMKYGRPVTERYINRKLRPFAGTDR